MKYTISSLFICSLILWTSCTNGKKAESEKVTTATELNHFHETLKNVHSAGVMFGHQDATVYGLGWEGDEDRSDVKSVCGDYPAIFGWEIGHIETGKTHSLDSISFDKIREEAIKQHQRGGLNSISWHLDNPVTGGDSWDISAGNKVVPAILPNGEKHEMFKTWLDALATYLNSFKTADGVKIPILFRPWHEHTGNWFWWGQDHCTVEEYKALWLFTYNYLKEKNVDNIIYAYSPGGGNPEEMYMEKYPGDEYVDLLGFDYYQMNGVDGNARFTEDMSNTLTYLTKLGEKHNKPIAITEAGFETIPYDTWWTDILYPIIDKYPVAYVLMWRNAREKPNHYYAPYPGHSSADNFVEFYNKPKTLFAKDVEKLYNYNK